MFAYNAQVGCDQHGWALAYSIDAGYKTPSIAKFLLDQNITPVFPYTRPRGKKGKLSPKEFIYEEYYDCYLCPENQLSSVIQLHRK